MLTEKANAICLLEVLKEYSDAEHILPMREIIAKMQSLYGIKIDRRTVYGAVALLIELGYDISLYENNGVGYYLRSRELEQSEVLLLTDARQGHKTGNRQIFWNIEQLDEAITRKKKVTLDYLHYGYDKRQHPTVTYTLSPYEMVYTNEHYYLICVPDHDPHTRLYRIDRMADIRILDEPRSETPAQKQEAQDAVYAFVGAPERVVLHCDRAVLDDVLDRFGTDIQIFERDEQTFTAVLTTPPRGVRFWALQYLSFVEVAEPAWLRQEIIEVLKVNHYLT